MVPVEDILYGLFQNVFSRMGKIAIRIVIKIASIKHVIEKQGYVYMVARMVQTVIKVFILHLISRDILLQSKLSFFKTIFLSN